LQYFPDNRPHIKERCVDSGCCSLPKETTLDLGLNISGSLTKRDIKIGDHG